MAQHTAQRRHQASDQSLAEDQVEDLCRPLVCSQSWLSTWRNRYEAHNATWAQERPKKPQSHPTQTPAHVARAVVSLRLTWRHNGTGGGATALMQALAQQGLAPVPSRRTMSRMVRRHHTEVKYRGSRSSISSDLYAQG